MSTPPTPNDLTRQQLDELDTLLQRMLSLPLSGPADAPATPAKPPSAAPLPTPPVNGWRADAAGGNPAPHLSEARVSAPPAVQLAPVLPQGVVTAPLPGWDPDPVARHRTGLRIAPEPEPFTPPTPETGVPPSAPDLPAAESDHPVVAGTLRGVDAPAVPFGFRSPFAEPPPATPAPTVTPEPAAVALNSAARLTRPRRTKRDRVPLPLWPLFAVNWTLEAALGLLGPVGAVLTRPAAKHALGVVGVLLMAAAAVWVARGLGYVTLPFPR